MTKVAHTQGGGLGRNGGVKEENKTALWLYSDSMIPGGRMPERWVGRMH